MKKTIISFVALAALTPCLTGCLEEFTPQSSTATAPQVEKADKAGLSRAIPSYMLNYSSSNAYDIGFQGMGLWRDAMSADFTVVDPAYDYYSWFSEQVSLGNYQLQYKYWERYYGLIQKANDLLSVADYLTNPDDAQYQGNALVYRAATYLDMQRTYEYRLTGVDYLDQQAQSMGIMGLTVPIVDENTTEADGRNNPRVPYYTLYRFILNDLNTAEKCLTDYRSVPSKTQASLGTCYGQLARTWLEIATRFERHPDDLATALAHEADNDIVYPAIGVSTAREAYAKAADYARKAINMGYTPLTKSQWFDTTTGFNTPNNSWMWCITISSSNGAASSCTWQSFISYTSPEANFGICTTDYNAERMIDRRLFETINPNDWRRATWIAPDEVADETAFNATYSNVTSLTFNQWKRYPAYVAFKFHPGGGERNITTIANAVSTPLMRVEEMYLIEAEATAYAQGLGAGKALLENFMNSYRMEGETYTSTAASLDDFVTELFNCKRVELWGEGLILWDYTRLEKAIIRGYMGTNHPEKYQYNSYLNRKAPWATYYIPDWENQRNPACKLNPDPSNAIPKWVP
ncbi:MAG: RagB/SusD family nutrient uptake outer membrane protein [Muribaculaceae bacterium]|nr:RagB/SusD family nutrient uptake outer membrane protein [Muribaculaceae bacterium]MDE7394249.1 RagB/SusD family nutrient uptake outer membrane protein [Muribaculaceae bacterium]